VPPAEPRRFVTASVHAFLVDATPSPRRMPRRRGRTPFQTVRANFPHTAYRRFLESQHYTAPG
jgi:hypothetical protein